MPEDASVTHWIHEVKAGVEGEAQQQIWARYFQRLMALARSRLGTLRAYEDAEDVALNALEAFFRLASQNRFPQLGDRTELWPLLVTITVRKATDLQRHQLAGCRDVRKNVSLQAVVGEEPTPEFAAEVFAEVNSLVEGLDDERLLIVAKLRLEGCSNKEIAERTGRSVKTVERRLAMIRKQLLEGPDA